MGRATSRSSISRIIILILLVKGCADMSDMSSPVVSVLEWISEVIGRRPVAFLSSGRIKNRLRGVSRPIRRLAGMVRNHRIAQINVSHRHRHVYAISPMMEIVRRNVGRRSRV